MGIYESLQRSAPAINDLAGLVQQHYKQKRLQENEQRFRDMLDGASTSTASGAGRSPFNLANASYDDILNIGQMLRETPEMQGEFNLIQQANAARQPKTTLMKTQRSIVPVTTDPTTNTTTVGNPSYQEPQQVRETAPKYEQYYDPSTGKFSIEEAKTGDLGNKIPISVYLERAKEQGMSERQTQKSSEKKKPARQTSLETDKDAKEKYVRKRYPDVDLKAALQGMYPTPPKGRSAEEILQDMQNGVPLQGEEKKYAEKVKAVDAYVRAHEKLYSYYDASGVDYDDPFAAAAPAPTNTTSGGKKQFTVGKQYKDGSGNLAVYRGNGKWEPVK